MFLLGAVLNILMRNVSPRGPMRVETRVLLIRFFSDLY